MSWCACNGSPVSMICYSLPSSRWPVHDAAHRPFHGSCPAAIPSAYHASCSSSERSRIKHSSLLGLEKLLCPSDNTFFHRNTPRRKSTRIMIENVVKRSPKRLKYFSGTRKVSEAVYLQVDPFGSDAWKLESAIKLLKDGAVGVIPTDTIYAIVCDLQNRVAIERIYRIKNMDPKKPLSILCRSFQDIDTYTSGFPRGNSQGHTNIFRAARQCLPGPYTFILPASKEMPKQCTNFGGSAASCAPRKSVGVRMPDDSICQAILKELDGPLVCTSVRRRADDEWMLDPVIIADTYGSSEGKEGVDFVVDGGVRIADPSTVVDMTGTKPTLLRRGKGVVEDWMLMETHDSVEAASNWSLANPYA